MDNCCLKYHVRIINIMNSFTDFQAKKIFKACKGECFFCSKKLTFVHRQKGYRGAWHTDHLVPVAKGGRTEITNGVAACVECNLKKSSSSQAEFIKAFGGENGISTRLRCHGFKKDGTRCSYYVDDTKRRYCRFHGKPLQFKKWH